MKEKLFKSLAAAVVGFIFAIPVLWEVLAAQPNRWLLILSSASLCFFMNLAAEWWELKDIWTSLGLALLSSFVWWVLLAFGTFPWLVLDSRTFSVLGPFVLALASAQFLGRTTIRLMEYYARKKAP